MPKSLKKRASKSTISFIAPPKKYLFSFETRFCLYAFGVLFLLCTASSITLKINVLNQKRQIATLDMKIKMLQEKNKDLTNQKTIEQAKLTKASEIFLNNSLLKDSIKNIFDLIPSNITLSYARLEEKKLILKGITPTKDSYNYMLLGPLKSIFSTNYTEFYPFSNGWYSFKSTNILEQE